VSYVYTERVEVKAPAERVWSVMSDVERWHEWTASITSVDLHGQPMGPAATATVRQPKLPTVDWTVTSYRPLEEFTWTSESRGIRTVGRHLMRAEGTSVQVELAIEQSGSLAWLANLLLARLTRRYLHLEATGLKQRCESSD
jgi:uncharacterized membrane protein